MSLELKAKEYAEKAHKGQVRKYTGEPYISHPEAVVRLLLSTDYTDAILAAAWLHDVVEDTHITFEQIYADFGASVALLVENVTNKSKPQDGNRKVRKDIDLAHLKKAYPAAQNIKLADIIDNTKNIVLHDPSFAATYLKEKNDQLAVLQGGDTALFQKAKKTLLEASYKLKELK
ncbi:HD domain-containing protein (plasmid) [Trichlorobacter lovleyi]|uniref:HD domain-containing protein n=1 Tax=Trichlorobacter lovleyi TaxID=313985 RepID=UPI00223F80B6|nr:HD domain-containing protein [Trichlorobacter lovleyi]QOX80819.1 HD domain-containing protein [Trichlorobacter lovleyi]